ncbi:hypothetical protein VMCG_07821 [Cytospora schulzeri]|uniref:Uncharacterized protein n=1 Tax=Cytospora schulzeri TaxID=448051 RepID=A0A423VZU9_9PEZI|nr:hypothetical protein VMCG_07821 [Valsa malicola]
MSGTLASMSQRGDQVQVKPDDRYELAVLTGIADNEGWSDERFTEALKELAEKRKNNTTASSAQLPTPKVPTQTCASKNEIVNVEKRQETVRITRQADKEGWGDEKTLAALRLRNSIHHELREKRKSDPNEPTEL